jgi:hypothetical protein
MDSTSRGLIRARKRVAYEQINPSLDETMATPAQGRLCPDQIMSNPNHGKPKTRTVQPMADQPIASPDHVENNKWQDSTWSEKAIVGPVHGRTRPNITPKRGPPQRTP